MHVGLIPDGNRRFMAKKHIENLLNSYDLGIGKFYDFLKWCHDLGVNEVTIYALSLENIQSRGETELNTLFNVFNKHALKGVTDKDLHERKIRINVCGDLDGLVTVSKNKELASEMVSNLRKLVSATSQYTNFIVNLAIAYGGRQEILYAAKKIVAAGEELTEENLSKNLWVPSNPDLLIRTSEARISNFMLWQLAYSEIYFVDKLWQEFDKKDLEDIISDFKSRDRRFGK
ncbi:MAG: di-trans,poly-cis-decaprenylcistransferase [Candidatus Altiarchaeota archaeon]|nr:di-trans,poly-cis-decaprenylcistransferase [Candidatus Altiarchaeota archaeon]